MYFVMTEATAQCTLGWHAIDLGVRRHKVDFNGGMQQDVLAAARKQTLAAAQDERLAIINSFLI